MTLFLFNFETFFSFPDEYVQAAVNSEISVRMERLSVVLNKEEYKLAEASASKLNANVVMRDGNMDVKGRCSEISKTNIAFVAASSYT